MGVYLYAPLPWQESLGYRVDLTLRNGKPRCRASVAEPRVGFHQCNKSGFVEVEGAWLCRIHDPAAEASRAADASAKWAAQDKARRVEWAGPRFRAALQQIADGHNDPRGLAREVLGDLYVDPAENSPSDMAAEGGLPPLSAHDDPLNPIPFDQENSSPSVQIEPPIGLAHKAED